MTQPTTHDGARAVDVTEAVADAVRSRVLPSLVAFFDQGLQLLACTEEFAAQQGADAAELCGRPLLEVVGAEVHDQLIGPALRAVAGATVHTKVRRSYPAGTLWLTLVAYQIDGEQLGVAVLTSQDT